MTIESCGTPLGVDSFGTPSPLAQSSLAYSLLEEIGVETLKYETALISVCRRRVFAISQALSITVTALLMKLTLVAEGSISTDVAEVCIFI
jgi:hypothetical protein